MRHDRPPVRAKTTQFKPVGPVIIRRGARSDYSPSGDQ